MSLSDKNEADSFYKIWESYHTFENFSRSKGEKLQEFINQWKIEMTSAQSAGCQYSDILLACKLIEKANLDEEGVRNILVAINSASSEVLSFVLGKLESYIFENSEGEEDFCTLVKDKNQYATEVKEEDQDKLSSSGVLYLSSHTKLSVKRQNGQTGQSELVKCPNCDASLEAIVGKKDEETKSMSPVTSQVNEKQDKKWQPEEESDSVLEIKVEPFDNAPALLGIEDIVEDVEEILEPVKTSERPLKRKRNHARLKKSKKRSIDAPKIESKNEDEHLKTEDRSSPVDTTIMDEENVEDELKFPCEFCGKRFKRKSLLQKHHRKFHNFANGEDRKVKVRKSWKGKNSQCEFCGKKVTQSWVKKHYEICPNRGQEDGETDKNLVKKEKDPFQCEFCGKEFPNISLLKVHYGRCTILEQEHGEEAKTYTYPSTTRTTCNICGKVFASPHNYMVHLTLHSGEKNFKCDICPAAFSHSMYLAAHRKRHEGLRPYKCDACTKSFSNNHGLKEHKMREHTLERPYQCDQCSYRSVSKHNLSRHYRGHTGERPFKCPLCEKAFTEKKGVKRHIRALHAQNDAKSDGDLPGLELKNERRRITTFI